MNINKVLVFDVLTRTSKNNKEKAISLLKDDGVFIQNMTANHSFPGSLTYQLGDKLVLLIIKLLGRLNAKKTYRYDEKVGSTIIITKD